MIVIRSLVVIGVAALLCSCFPYSYLEPSGPGKQNHYKRCNYVEAIESLNIALPHHVTAYVEARQVGSTTVIEITLQSANPPDPIEVQLTALEVPLTIKSSLFDSKSFAYLASISDKFVPYDEYSKQGPLKDGTAVTSRLWTSVRKSGFLDLHMVFAFPGTPDSFLLDFPPILINSEQVQIEPISFKKKVGAHGPCG
jgi:hypothetical protein